MNSHNGHHTNKFGVCTTCAMEKAKDASERKATLWTDDPKEQEKVKDKFMWDEFWKLTTPDGR